MKKLVKPILVGMVNPHNLDPRWALAPFGKNTAGKRLFLILKSRVPAVRRIEYVKRFERVNLCHGTYDETRAHMGAQMLREKWSGRHILLLGGAVRRAFGFPPCLIDPVEDGGNTWFQLPHPSGRCLWYNDPTNRARAADLLTQLYRTDRETF